MAGHGKLQRKSPFEIIYKKITTIEQKELTRWAKLLESAVVHPGHADEILKQGVWACCCCRSIIQFMVLPGKHPLSVMRCGKCQHVWCKGCPTTQLVRILASPPDREGMVWVLDPKKPPPFAYLCRRCGLSYRARLGKSKAAAKGCFHYPLAHCACGQKVGKLADWSVVALPGCDFRRLDSIEHPEDPGNARLPKDMELEVELGLSFAEYFQERFEHDSEI